MSDPKVHQTTPFFMDRKYRHTGPVPLDYDRGEFWIHGIGHDGARSTAPFIKQRDGEDVPTFVARIHAAEAAIPGWEFPSV